MNRPYSVQMRMEAGGRAITRKADRTRAVGFTIVREDTGDTISFTLTTDGGYTLEFNNSPVVKSSLSDRIDGRL